MLCLKPSQKVTLNLLLVLGALTSCVKAQGSDANKEYRLISTVKSSSFERQLNDAALQGFRVELLAQSVRIASLTVLVARAETAAKHEPTVEYKLIGFGDFKKQKDGLGKAGFRCRGALYPNALIGMVAAPFVLLERQLAVHLSAEFEIIESKKESERQQKINAAAVQGFTPVSVTHAYTLLQRETNAMTSSLSSKDYRLVDTYKISTLEKEMNLIAKDGYCFVLSSALNTVIMAKEKQLTGSMQCEYKLASLSESGKLMQQVALLAKEQFRFQGVTQLGAAVIFERSINQPRSGRSLEYKVLETFSEETMVKELSAATKSGFVPLSLGHGVKGFLSIFLYREAPVGPSN